MTDWCFPNDSSRASRSDSPVEGNPNCMSKSSHFQFAQAPTLHSLCCMHRHQLCCKSRRQIMGLLIFSRTNKCCCWCLHHNYTFHFQSRQDSLSSWSLQKPQGTRHRDSPLESWFVQPCQHSLAVPEETKYRHNLPGTVHTWSRIGMHQTPAHWLYLLRE